MQANAQHDLIASADRLRQLSERLRAEEVIALDTEFIRETTFFPIIALIQVATDRESWLIDPIALAARDLKPFLDLLGDRRILKVLHAAQADQECLFTSYGVIATPSFDTAMAASLCGYGESVGLAKLLREALGVTIRKGHARTDWTRRPLQDQLMVYAHLDVRHLVDLARHLMKALDASGRRAWACELSARYENPALYEPNPDALSARIARNGRIDRRGYAALRELVAWREARVRAIDVPRRRVADDDVLAALANVRPRDIEHLSAFRGLNRGELKHSGQAILEAVKRAAVVPEGELPEVPRAIEPEPHEARALELLQIFARLLADQHRIAPRHLVDGESLLALLRGRFESLDDLSRARVLSEGAARLIGEELFEFVRGRRVLGLRGDSIAVASGKDLLPGKIPSLAPARH